MTWVKLSIYRQGRSCKFEWSGGVNTIYPTPCKSNSTRTYQETSYGLWPDSHSTMGARHFLNRSDIIAKAGPSALIIYPCTEINNGSYELEPMRPGNHFYHWSWLEVIIWVQHSSALRIMLSTLRLTGYHDMSDMSYDIILGTNFIGKLGKR